MKKDEVSQRKAERNVSSLSGVAAPVDDHSRHGKRASRMSRIGGVMSRNSRSQRNSLYIPEKPERATMIVCDSSVPGMIVEEEDDADEDDSASQDDETLDDSGSNDAVT